MKTLGSVLQIPPKAIHADTLYLVGLVTVVSILHMISMLIRVGSARKKFKVLPPKTEGDPRFSLVYRAHQNCVENYPIFLAAMWSAAIFFNQVPAAILGALYILFREIYFVGYSSKAEKRVIGFLFSSLTLLGLLTIAAIGAGNIAYRSYRGQDLLKGWVQAIPVPYL